MFALDVMLFWFVTKKTAELGYKNISLPELLPKNYTSGRCLHYFARNYCAKITRGCWN